MSGQFSRLLTYHKRHGFLSTLRRTAVFVRRAVSANRMILFYYDFPKTEGPSSIRNWPRYLKVERKTSQEETDQQDWRQIVNFWNPELSRRQLAERFRKGASLWLVRSEEKLAGYGWTLSGRTVESHFHPLGSKDVHLFDFLVFPEYRGQQINPLLIIYILDQLRAECRTRAFIEAAEWNQAQLSSLRKTPFCPLGRARKLTVFRHTIVFWDESPTVKKEQKDELNNVPMAAIRRQDRTFHVEVGT